MGWLQELNSLFTSSMVHVESSPLSTLIYQARYQFKEVKQKRVFILFGENQHLSFRTPLSRKVGKLFGFIIIISLFGEDHYNS